MKEGDSALVPDRCPRDEFVRLACVLALSTDAVAALTKAQIGAVERPCGGTERLPRLWRCPPDDTASLPTTSAMP